MAESRLGVFHLSFQIRVAVTVVGEESQFIDIKIIFAFYGNIFYFQLLHQNFYFLFIIFFLNFLYPNFGDIENRADLNKKIGEQLEKEVGKFKLE